MNSFDKFAVITTIPTFANDDARKFWDMGNAQFLLAEKAKSWDEHYTRIVMGVKLQSIAQQITEVMR